MSRYKVTLHALKPGGKDEVSYREAESITLASAPVWASIPRADHYHYTVSIEYAPLPAPPEGADS
jgi:hypothetical protein